MDQVCVLPMFVCLLVFTVTVLTEEDYRPEGEEEESEDVSSGDEEVEDTPTLSDDEPVTKVPLPLDHTPFLSLNVIHAEVKVLSSHTHLTWT